MSRFERFSRVSLVQLYHERLRLLRRAALAVLLLLSFLSAVLLLPGLHSDGSVSSPVAPGVASALCAPAPPSEPESAAIPSVPDLTAIAPTPRPPLSLLPAPAATGPCPVVLPVPNLDITPREATEHDILLADMSAGSEFSDTLTSSAAAPALSTQAAPPPQPTAHAARAASSAKRSTAAPRAAAAAGSSTSVTPPRYLKAPPPPYPPDMQAGRYSGNVGVLIKVGADGSPLAVHITRTSGRREFDEVARDWILKHWRFHPARRGGAAEAADVKTSVIFSAD